MRFDISDEPSDLRRRASCRCWSRHFNDGRFMVPNERRPCKLCLPPADNDDDAEVLRIRAIGSDRDVDSARFVTVHFNMMAGVENGNVYQSGWRKIAREKEKNEIRCMNNLPLVC